MQVILFFDGGSRGNPGPAGAGYWITNGDTPHGGYKYLGHQTNNVAEYNGLILGLEQLSTLQKSHSLDSELSVKIYGDSKLVIEQCKGNWKIKAPHLVPLHRSVLDLLKGFKNVEFTHVLRHLNTNADAMANMAIDTKSFGTTPQ